MISTTIRVLTRAIELVMAVGALAGLLAVIGLAVTYEVGARRLAHAKRDHEAQIAPLRDRRAGITDVEVALQPLGVSRLQECGYELRGGLCPDVPSEGRVLLVTFPDAYGLLFIFCRPAALLHFDATNSLVQVKMTAACLGP